MDQGEPKIPGLGLTFRPSKTRRFTIVILSSSSVIVLSFCLISIGILLDKHFHPGYRPGGYVRSDSNGNVGGEAAAKQSPQAVAVADEATPYPPSHIILQVNDDGELTLAPQAGDLIEWQLVDFSDTMTEAIERPHVKFTSQTPPCLTSGPYLNDGGYCSVTAAIQDATYRYSCSTTNPDTKCADPALGPRSRSGRGLVAEATYSNWEELEDVGIKVDCKLLDTKECPIKPPRQIAQEAPQPIRGWANNAQAFNPAPIAVKLTSTIHHEHDAHIGCESGKTKIVSDNGDDKMTASPGDTLYWTSTGKDLTFFGATDRTPMKIQFGASSCKVEKLSFAKNVWECVVPVDVSNVNVDYTVQDADNACNANQSATGHIKVP